MGDAAAVDVLDLQRGAGQLCACLNRSVLLYFAERPDRAYCSVVIRPKVDKLKHLVESQKWGRIAPPSFLGPGTLRQRGGFLHTGLRLGLLGFRLPSPEPCPWTRSWSPPTGRRSRPPRWQSRTTSLDRDTLLSLPALTVDDALSSVRGWSLFRRDGSLTANPTTQGVSLRGLGPSGASRTLVLLDGIPLNDPFRRLDHLEPDSARFARENGNGPGGGATAWGNSARGVVGSS